MTTMHHRSAKKAIETRLAEAPVVRLSGPRAVGKTTTCAQLVEQHNGTIIRLDDPNERRAVSADVAGFLSNLAAPILIDEYQKIPETLEFIKSDLSRNGNIPGKWLLSGSVAISAVTAAAESLGGRLSDVTMSSLTLDERNDQAESHFLSHILNENVEILRGWRPHRSLNRDDLLHEATRSGLPLVTDRSTASARRRGLVDWVNASVIADGSAVGGVRNVEDLRRMLRLYAAATGSITPKDKPTADSLEINRKTVASYRDLLASLHVTWDLPAFIPGNTTGQVTRTPKLHIFDSGLAANLVGRDQPESLTRDQQFAGALIETMVANDLRVQASVHDDTPRLLHFREDSHEVDVVVEAADGSVVGIEIKLSSNPGDKDFSGLRRLRRSAGNRWLGGILLCRIPAGRMIDENITAAPLEAVWQMT